MKKLGERGCFLCTGHWASRIAVFPQSVTALVLSCFSLGIGLPLRSLTPGARSMTLTGAHALISSLSHAS